MIYGKRSVILKRLACQHTGRRWHSVASRQVPLRILYCGSDEFSAVSLRKLHEHKFKSTQIESLEVVCKEGKRSGRGLRQIRDVPIKSVARELDLPLHEIPTFTGWSPPAVFNLIVAVSFGLKVPPRLLQQATYGGLNLHPSLLPDLRGPAPVHHALLEGRKTTGITLQTLHPHHFDHGTVIAQKPFAIPRQGNCTFQELHSYSATVAADLLIDSLANGRLLQQPDGSNSGQPPAGDSAAHLTHARKVTPEDAHVDWATWPAERTLRTQRAFKHVWSFWPSRRDGQELRVQWHQLSLVDSGLLPSFAERGHATPRPGQPVVVAKDGASEIEGCSSDALKRGLAGVLIPTCDGRYLRCERVTIEGRAKCEAAARGVAMLLEGRI